MAHSCPDCCETCYCGGDVDDAIIDEPLNQIACGHNCENDDPERDFDWDDYDDVGTHREG